MPTRFKYAKVDSQTFGLTPAEILMATDAELNTYMGLKKYAPYRKEGKGRNWDGQRASRLGELKQKLRERGVAGDTGARAAGLDGEKTKKRKGKKERMREKAAAAASSSKATFDENHEKRQEFRRMIDPGILRPNPRHVALESLQVHKSYILCVGS